MVLARMSHDLILWLHTVEIQHQQSLSWYTFQELPTNHVRHSWLSSSWAFSEPIRLVCGKMEDSRDVLIAMATNLAHKLPIVVRILVDCLPLVKMQVFVQSQSSIFPFLQSRWASKHSERMTVSHLVCSCAAQTFSQNPLTTSPYPKSVSMPSTGDARE